MKSSSDIDGWDSPVCTARKCRAEVNPGYGNQFIDADGEHQRYCWPCYQAYMNGPMASEPASQSDA
jgi:hypothetical protein